MKATLLNITTKLERLSKACNQRFPLASLSSRLVHISAFIILCLFVAGCVSERKDSGSVEDISIIEGEINGVRYFIPEDYFVPPFKRISDNTIYVRAIYPDFAPITVDMQTLFDQKQQHRKIDILAKYVPNALPSDQYVKNVIDKTWKAYKIVDEQYGLIHQTQPEGYNQDNHDLWLEKKNGAYVSYINCCKKLTERSVPQCSDHVFKDGFHIKTNFNKRLLPEWQIIRQTSLGLLESFKSKQLAKEFIKQTSHKDQKNP